MAFSPLKLFVLKGPLRGRVGFIVPTAVFLVVFILAGGFIWSANRSKTRVVVLNIETQVVTLRSLGQGVAWFLPGATVCRPRPEGFDSSLAVGEGACDDRRFETIDNENVTIDWLAGQEAHISVRADDLIIRTLNPYTKNFPTGTLIIVPSANWKAMGSLVFAAEMTVGEPLQSGLSSQLLGGSWEMRQSGWAIAPGRSDVTEIVKDGIVMSGSVVQVWENCPDTSRQYRCGPRAPAVLYGHLLPVNKNDAVQLDLVAFSAPGQTELSIGYFGSSTPSTIRPSLLDFAITSPLLLAMAFFLSIIASLTQVFSSFSEMIKGRRKTRDRNSQ